MQGRGDSSRLEALGNSCGVDVQGLFARYSSQKENENATTRGTCTTSTNQTCSNGGGQLDNLNICSRCDGLGLVQISYNFQTRDANCDHCNGDGVISKQPSSRR